MVKPARKKGRGDRLCHLCLTEKVFILRGDPGVLLNKRSEIMQNCRHKAELMLDNYTSQSSKRKREQKRAQRRINGTAVSTVREEEEEGEQEEEEGERREERHLEEEEEDTGGGGVSEEEEQAGRTGLRVLDRVDYRRFL